MKQFLLLFSPLVCLTSCVTGNSKTGNSYFKTVEKLKSYNSQIVMSNRESNGYYYEEGFFVSEGEVLLYSSGSSSKSFHCVYLTLPNSTKAPNVYKCLYLWRMSTSESATFYIQNTYTKDDIITFDSYDGSDTTLQTDINLAKLCVNEILYSFEIWLRDELNSGLSKIGMFPNFL